MMNCAEFETVLADYVDGGLAEPGRSALEQHAAACSACQELMADVTGAVAFLKRAEPVFPPPELITRIAYQAPAVRTRQWFEPQGVWSKISSGWLEPLLRPRFAMGMAMTILSFAMLQRCTGVQVQHIQPADLSPIRIWDGVEDRVMRVKDRAVKYYENVRFIYKIETRLKDLQAQQEAASSEQAKGPGGTEEKALRGTNEGQRQQAPTQKNKREGENEK